MRFQPAPHAISDAFSVTLAAIDITPLALLALAALALAFICRAATR